MAYFDLSKLNLAYTNVMKAFESKMQWCRRDKVALRSTCIKNVKFKIIRKDRLSILRILLLQRKPLTGPHETFDWAASARWLDIADLVQRCTTCGRMRPSIMKNILFSTTCK